MFHGIAGLRRGDADAWSVFATDLGLELEPMQGIILRLEKTN
jgi:hypothetical protein